ncbi:MAG: DUF4116 domain-containing protein [Erysipelotrichaceae bacterium]
MGRHEEFIYSAKYAPEQIAKILLNGQDTDKLNDNKIDIICKATTLHDIEGSDFKNIKKETSGLIVSCPNFQTTIQRLPFHLKLRTNAVRLDHISYRMDGFEYSDYFEDSNLAMDPYDRNLQYASAAQKKDKDFVLEAVKQDGNQLQYANEDFKNDKDVVLEAIKQNAEALQFASTDVRDDKDVLFEVIKQNAESLQLALDLLKNDMEIAEKQKEQQEREEQQIKEKDREEPPLQNMDKALNNDKVIQYLQEEKGLSKEIIQDYLDRNVLYQDDKDNCVFLGRYENTVAYVQKQPTTGAYNGDVLGHSSALGVFIDHNSDTIIVNNAVIDQMSYRQLIGSAEKKYDYLACCDADNAQNAIEFHMQNRGESQRIKNIILALDHDEASEENTLNTIEYIKANFPNVKTMVHIPEGNNFNDDLKKLQGFTQEGSYDASYDFTQEETEYEPSMMME